MKILIILFFMSTFVLYSQVISELTLVDGYSAPLEYGDDGIKIKYKTTLSGQINAYLKTSHKGFTIISGRQELKGIGYINISAKTLSTLCNYGNIDYSNNYFELTHISTLYNEYTPKRIPLKIEINAPYGCELKNYPSKPDLYSTNYKKKIVNPLAVTGLVAGGLAATSGAVIYFANQKKGDSKDANKEQTANILMYSGALLAVLCIPVLHKWAIDTERNKYNQNLNENLLSNWKIDCKRIERFNNLVRATYKIRFSSL